MERIVKAKRSVIVQQSTLQQNYPNPFNRVTNIPFSISHSSLVQVNIYDISGRHVKELVNSLFTQGDHVVQWNASGLPSGSYFYELKVGDSSQLRKCMLIY